VRVINSIFLIEDSSVVGGFVEFFFILNGKCADISILQILQIFMPLNLTSDVFLLNLYANYVIIVKLYTSFG